MHVGRLIMNTYYGCLLAFTTQPATKQFKGNIGSKIQAKEQDFPMPFLFHRDVY